MRKKSLRSSAQKLSASQEPTLFPLEVSFPPRHEHEPFWTYPERLPLVYGSAEVVFCKCGCWRLNRGCNDEWTDKDIRVEMREALEACAER